MRNGSCVPMVWYQLWHRRGVFLSCPNKKVSEPSLGLEMRRSSNLWERTAGPSTTLRSVEKHFQERTADTADLSTTLLRSSGRDDKGERAGRGKDAVASGQRLSRRKMACMYWVKEPQVAPLRFAPGGMTILPETLAATQNCHPDRRSHGPPARAR